MNISLFGWLESIDSWHLLPYKTKGTIIRGLKSGISVTLGILLAAAGQGILFPTTWSPMVVLVVTTFLQSLDKYLREAQLEKAMLADPVPTDSPQQ